MSGSGSTVKDIVVSAVTSGGHSIEVYANGTVKTLDGEEAGTGKMWVLYQWMPLEDWVFTYMNSNGDSDLDSGTSYYIYLADVTVDGSTTEYSTPSSFEPTATAYFFIKFVEDVNANTYVTSILTETQRSEGFWISGTGSDVAEAFSDACNKYGFELNMNLQDGNYLKGWLGSFLGLSDVKLSNGDWNNWSQFYWNTSTQSWTYGDCMGHYDPEVTKYFCLVRQVTEEDNATAGTSVTPSDAPISYMENGCTVSFVDGDGNVIKTQNVSYFGSATAPTTVTKSSSGNTKYTFTGWDKTFSQVTGDITVTAQFRAVGSAAVTGVTITSSQSIMQIGSTYAFKAQVLPSDAADITVTWTSSNDAVATVDSNGLVTAVSSGTVTISVTTNDGNKTAVVKVTVQPPAGSVSSISLDCSFIALQNGDSVTLTANTLPDDASDSTVSWSSSDESVATVDSNGKVKVVSDSGTAVITVKTNDGGLTATCKVVAISDTSEIIIADISGTGDDSYTVKITKAQLEKLIEEGSTYTIISDIGTVTLSADVLENIADDDASLSVSVYDYDGLTDAQKKVIGSNTVYEYLMNDGSISDLGGEVTVSIPYILDDGESADDIRIYSVDWKGNVEEFECTYDSSKGEITFTTEHFSLYFASISSESSSGSDLGSSGSGDLAIYAGIAVVIIVIILLAGFAIYKRNKA